MNSYPASEHHGAHNPISADYPVSARETRIAHGTLKLDIIAAETDVWSFPGVRDKRPTAGIVPGAIIELWDGDTVTVTRVGTIAGWGMSSYTGSEIRWDASFVRNIHSGTDLISSDDTEKN